MSKTVDEKVVEMRFDNAQFERNVTTSMGTLDKLKKALNFKDSSKSLETVSAAAKKVDMSGLYNGVETVRMKFSALEVMAVTALANITNSAVNAGKRMISALTIQPVKDGFAEYETQMNAVQTILANTQKEGTNVKMVNAALDDLNHYADKTIYNFTEMTRNIGTFTAAGVKLGTSVSSITGINSGTSGVLSQLNTIMTNMRTMIISRGSVFMSAGVQLMNSLSGGIRNGGSRVNSALTSALSGCSATIRSYHSSFVSAGAYLGSGLVSGINSKSDAVYKAGYRLGEKAVAGEKAGQQSASPSKLTRKAGRWLGEGLIIGMKEMSTAVYSSGKSMGRSASDSITEALSSISNIDDWNVDTDPSITIHPVFDMSNIDSGLNYIDSALSGTKAVQLSSSVAAITPVSSLTNQNVSNQDVVNAINKLRKDIGSKTGNTYNLGGITYDDGSNVADAVESLVRAVKIEGRR